MCPIFFIFKGRIVFHLVYILHSVHMWIHWYKFWLFSPFDYCEPWFINNESENMSQPLLSIVWGYIPRSRLAGLKFENPQYHFPWQLYHFTFLPEMNKDSHLFTIVSLAIFCYCYYYFSVIAVLFYMQWYFNLTLTDISSRATNNLNLLSPVSW